ncbi:cytochrome b [uncultured Roseobacter sp.]|uniref:cytochrome b n=1 Tax=uncultured Roseobacter sp. TaxID=114847 RepID=UPI002608E034|nr:cytochrome b [uncultured Roseobacter sp.]
MPETKEYSSVSRFNHWIVAIAMIGMLGFGLYLEFGGLEREAKRPLVGIHRSIGVLVLTFGIWRVGWRLGQGFPAPVAAMPDWQLRGAKAVHWSLLAGIVIMPASGIVFTVFRGNPVSVFGWFEIPAQSEISWIVSVASALHTYVGYLLVAVVVLHVGAALKHHFIDRDTTLRRMMSGN